MAECIELEVDNASEVSIDSDIGLSSTSTYNIDSCDSSEANVTINKKEYSIVGDEIYIPQFYDDAPPWLQNLVDQTIQTSLQIERDNLNQATESLNTLIAELEIAKNTYTQSIISSNDIDQRINTAITTLNSSLSASDATILNIAQTATTPEEATAISIAGINAELGNTDAGSLGAQITDANQARVSGDQANADSITTLTSTIQGEVDARASAIETINTYVGIDEAGASTNTGLSAYLEGSDGVVGSADSDVANAVYIDGGNPVSKFEYSSLLSKNGVYYTSGFGLNTLVTGGNGTEGNPYDSEFWINAAKFKFTNDNETGQATPFTIDAVGATPQVTFDGVVDFTNTNIANGYPGTTTIDGGNITADTVNGSKIITDTLSADRLLSTSGNTTVWEGGGLVSQNFNGNVHGSIGSPTSGFRLSSAAAGTSDDPNIYGAYIKGGVFDVGDVQVKSDIDDTRFGAISHSIISGSFVGQSQGAVGYLVNRVCSNAAQIVVRGGLDWSMSHSNTNFYAYSITALLQYTVNGGSTWVTIDSITVSDTTQIVSGQFFQTKNDTIDLFGLVSGSVVVPTGTIEFRITSSGSNTIAGTSRYLATLNNQ